MIEKLEYGKSYAIYLNSLYGGYKSNVRIIGKTNIDNVVSNNDDDYNIYKTYFRNLNIFFTFIKIYQRFWNKYFFFSIRIRF